MTGVALLSSGTSALATATVPGMMPVRPVPDGPGDRPRPVGTGRTVALHQHKHSLPPDPCEDPLAWSQLPSPPPMVVTWCHTFRHAKVTKTDGAVCPGSIFLCKDWRCHSCAVSEVSHFLTRLRDVVWTPYPLLWHRVTPLSIEATAETLRSASCEWLLVVRQDPRTGSKTGYIWASDVISAIAPRITWQQARTTWQQVSPQLTALWRLRDQMCLPGPTEVLLSPGWREAKVGVPSKHDCWEAYFDPAQRFRLEQERDAYARQYGVRPGTGQPLPDARGWFDQLLQAGVLHVLV